MLGETYHANPSDLVEPWALTVVATWAQCRGEFGLQHLPDAGAINDQAAWLLDAFSVCAAAEAELVRAERPDRPGG